MKPAPGMGAVVYNGSVILKLSPLGDFLALSAAIKLGFLQSYHEEVVP